MQDSFSLHMKNQKVNYDVKTLWTLFDELHLLSYLIY